MSGRLDYMQDHQLAIQTLQEELRTVEAHAGSGGSFDEQDIQLLRQVLRRLTCLLNTHNGDPERDWDSDAETLPQWLQPRPDVPVNRIENKPKRL